MAGFDYLWCARCDERVFYDAELRTYPDGEATAYGVALAENRVKVLCAECGRTHELVVVNRSEPKPKE